MWQFMESDNFIKYGNSRVIRQLSCCNFGNFKKIMQFVTMSYFLDISGNSLLEFPCSGIPILP